MERGLKGLGLGGVNSGFLCGKEIDDRGIGWSLRQSLGEEGYIVLDIA